MRRAKVAIKNIVDDLLFSPIFFMNPDLVTVGGKAVLCFLPGLDKAHLSLAGAMRMETNILQSLTVVSDKLGEVRPVATAPTP